MVIFRRVTRRNTAHKCNGSNRINFGKWKGHTFEKVWMSDREYCLWVYKRTANKRYLHGVKTKKSNYWEFASWVTYRIDKNEPNSDR